MLSGEVRKIMTDASVDGNQRFKALIEGLRIARKISPEKISKLIGTHVHLEEVVGL